MSTPKPAPHPDADTGVAPLGGETTEPVEDDGPDGMAGLVYPSPETEPDAH